MSKGSWRLQKFWLVLAALVGASIGAAGAASQGLTSTVWVISGVGLPILLVIGVLEWTAGGAKRERLKQWREARGPTAQPQGRRGGNKLAPRRVQLHAINGRKTLEPPSSGNA